MSLLRNLRIDLMPQSSRVKNLWVSDRSNSSHLFERFSVILSSSYSMKQRQTLIRLRNNFSKKSSRNSRKQQRKLSSPIDWILFKMPMKYFLWMPESLPQLDLWNILSICSYMERERVSFIGIIWLDLKKNKKLCPIKFFDKSSEYYILYIVINFQKGRVIWIRFLRKTRYCLTIYSQLLFFWFWEYFFSYQMILCLAS